MTTIDFSPEGMKVFAEKMAKSEKGIRSILDELDKDVKEVEPHWGGDSQQQFKRFYNDWRKGMDMHIHALGKTSEKLTEIVEKYPKIT
jgi:WXG100 family type VII secretion target